MVGWSWLMLPRFASLEPKLQPVTASPTSAIERRSLFMFVVSDWLLAVRRVLGHHRQGALNRALRGELLHALVEDRAIAGLLGASVEELERRPAGIEAEGLALHERGHQLLVVLNVDPAQNRHRRAGVRREGHRGAGAHPLRQHARGLVEREPGVVVAG